MADLLLNAPIQYEPLRQNRFLLRFPSDLGIQEWWVSTAQRPKINIQKTPIPFLNTETYVAGRYTWQPISITLRDPIGPSASQAIMEWVRLHAESVTASDTSVTGNLAWLPVVPGSVKLMVDSVEVAVDNGAI